MMNTRSQSTKARTQHVFEPMFRRAHQLTIQRGVPQLGTFDCWSKNAQIIWWSTGIEEGVFEDDQIPEALYGDVYNALLGR